MKNSYILRAGLVVLFSTAAMVSAAPKASRQEQKLTPKMNKDAITVLQDVIDQQYAYRDLRNVNWDNLFRVFGPRMIKSRTAEEFSHHGADMLGRSGDAHIWVTFDKGCNGNLWWAFEPNYNTKFLEKKVPNWERKNAFICVGHYPEGVGYLQITSWENFSKSNFKPAFDAIQAFSDSKGLIIDIRPCFGGQEEIAAELAGCFVEKPVVYARHADRIRGKAMRFTPSEDHVLHPLKDRPRYRGKVVVLTGPQNTDASELFCLMMKQVSECKLIGAKTRGCVGRKIPTDLGNGAMVWLTTRKFMRPDNTCLEGDGIKPDLEVKTTRAQLRKKDPVLSMGMKVLLNNETIGEADQKK